MPQKDLVSIGVEANLYSFFRFILTCALVQALLPRCTNYFIITISGAGEKGVYIILGLFVLQF